MSRIVRKRNQIPRALQTIDVKAVLRRRGVYLQQRENRRLKAAAKPLAEILVKNKALKAKGKKELVVPEIQKYASLTNGDAHDYWQKQIHVVSVVETHFELAIKKFLHDVQTTALAKLDTIVAQHPKSLKAQTKALQVITKDVFSDTEANDLVNQATISLQPLLENVGVITGQAAMQSTGSSDPYIPSDSLRAQVGQNVSRFTQSMVSTDQDHLGGIITDGITNGDSIPQIRASITNDFSQYSNMQATRISRTEVLRASNDSAVDAFQQSGLVEGKQWLTAGADDECADYDGQVVGLDGNFYDNTDEFADGDPPLHPNCRCVLIPVLADDSGGDSGGLIPLDESGAIGGSDQFSGDDISIESSIGATVYHGEGHNLHNNNVAMLGNAMYVARDQSVAAKFGDTTELKLPFSDKDILKINNNTEYEDFVKNAQKYALDNGASLETSDALPAYIQSLGYRAAELSDSVDPMGGIGIVDQDAIKALHDQIDQANSSS